MRVTTTLILLALAASVCNNLGCQSSSHRVRSGLLPGPAAGPAPEWLRPGPASPQAEEGGDQTAEAVSCADAPSSLVRPGSRA